MEKLTLFYLEDCPYCRNARKALAELTEENAAYTEVPVEWIEEIRQPDVADKYDYYYVPTVFSGSEKLYEAAPGESYADCKANMKAAWGRVLGA